jgi:hypothetical protein
LEHLKAHACPQEMRPKFAFETETPASPAVQSRLWLFYGGLDFLFVLGIKMLEMRD